MYIRLEFDQSQSIIHRARLDYAFRLFCALYGHNGDTGSSAEAEITLTYAADTKAQKYLPLTNGYLPRSVKESAPPPYRYAERGTPNVLVHRVTPPREPDWLGEIFEWVSCADEYAVNRRDRVGRISFADSYMGRHHLDPLCPYAAAAMQALQEAICDLCPGAARKTPSSPIPFVQHVVVNTHDVDFLPNGPMQSVGRLAKNALISLLIHRKPRATFHQVKSATSVAAGGCDPLNQVVALADREAHKGLSSTFYFLCDHQHRRDGNYNVDDAPTQSLMHLLVTHNNEIGVHGSYRSAEHPETLAHEFEHLRRIGFQPLGSRQHWLRFTLPQLIESVIDARAAYDCSLGWPSTPGFRAGACFAFPPYNFDREEPSPFLELPLVLMDQELVTNKINSLDLAKQLLATSRRYGWGGVSVLWHPTAFGSGQLPAKVGEVFWDLLADGLEQQDAWMSAGLFVKQVWHRYCEAGLLPHREF